MKSLEEAVLSNNIQYIEQCSAAEILAYKNDEYTNIFLLAVRESDVATLKTLVKILNQEKISEREKIKLFTAKDVYDRSALQLAAITNDMAVIIYLIKLNYLDKAELNQAITDALITSINRNCKKSFHYLLAQTTDFDESVIRALHDPKNSRFLDYFNSTECFLKLAEYENIPALKHLLRKLTTEPEKFWLACNKYEQDALIIAAYNGNTETIKLLLQRGIEFDLSSVDIHDYSAICWLLENEEYDLAVELAAKKTLLQPMEAALFKTALPDMDLTKSYKGSLLLKALSRNPTGMLQNGRISKAKNEESRPYRSFAGEREKQLLRQFSTQLYLGAKNFLTTDDKKKFKEVQCLHLKLINLNDDSHPEKNFIFVALNEFRVAPSIYTHLQEKFRALLTDNHAIAKDAEGQTRSRRYAGKLRHRVFGRTIKIPNVAGDTAADQYEAENVAYCIKRGSLQTLSLVTQQGKLTDATAADIKNFLDNENDVIVLVEPKGYVPVECHAEKFLIDIAKFAKKYSEQQGFEIYTAMGGKKRPCTGCCASMEQSNAINTHGKYPGKFWLNTATDVAPEITRAISETLLSKSSYFSRGTAGERKDDYDSGSDSDVSSDVEALSPPKARCSKG
jgi:ankyrin repeat protein